MNFWKYRKNIINAKDFNEKVKEQFAENLKEYNKRCFKKILDNLESYLARKDVTCSIKTREEKNHIVDFIENGEKKYRLTIKRSYDDDYDNIRFWDVKTSSYDESWSEMLFGCCWVDVYIFRTNILHSSDDGQILVEYIKEHATLVE